MISRDQKTKKLCYAKVFGNFLFRPRQSSQLLEFGGCSRAHRLAMQSIFVDRHLAFQGSIADRPPGNLSYSHCETR